MGRIIAIDYGKKRTGLAWSDPLRITAQPLYTVPTEKLLDTLRELVSAEPIETFVLGKAEARYFNPNRDIEAEKQTFFHILQKEFPRIPVVWEDEDLSTREAREILRLAPKKKRQDKNRLNVISAMIILQRYLENI